MIIDRADLAERIEAMSDEDLRALDQICKALGEYLRREHPPVMAVPNRAIALSCVDLLRQWQRMEIEGEPRVNGKELMK